MSEKHLRWNPYKIEGRNDVWWYEAVDGICLVIEPQPKTEQITIPWSEIRKALARKDKP